MRVKTNQLLTMRIIGLEEFRTVVDELVIETRNEFPHLYFDHAGIIPEYDEKAAYNCSPTNTKVFARTGGDGVHYSILEISEEIQPVVMTVPMNFGGSMRDYNWIIGENLNEFLSIGYYNGWFPIEQLCYGKKAIIDFYSTENMDEDFQKSADIQFIKKLMNKWELVHVPLNIERLDQLADKYFQYLEFNPEFIERHTKSK